MNTLDGPERAISVFVLDYSSIQAAMIPTCYAKAKQTQVCVDRPLETQPEEYRTVVTNSRWRRSEAW